MALLWMLGLCNRPSTPKPPRPVVQPILHPEPPVVADFDFDFENWHRDDVEFFEF
jgi:hypothetical protein